MEQWGPEKLAKPAEILAERFIQRRDLYAVQLVDGRYVCVHQHLKTEHIHAHLRGEITLGTYLLDPESQVRFVVFDSDSSDGWNDLRDIAARLANDNVPAYIEKSRRGGHLWIFFARPVAGLAARKFAQGVLDSYHVGNIEIYPKQDTVGKGPGSLVRLPFGIHRLTRRRYGFYGNNGKPLAQTLSEQIYALQSPQFVSDALLNSYISRSPSLPPDAHPKPLDEPTDVVSKRIKAAVTVLEFISRYVDLRQTTSGAVGLCPFHDDQHSSFGVNDKENYWHCFAGCGGGSIIDFWSRWREKQELDSGFVATITELAEMIF